MIGMAIVIYLACNQNLADMKTLLKSSFLMTVLLVCSLSFCIAQQAGFRPASVAVNDEMTIETSEITPELLAYESAMLFMGRLSEKESSRFNNINLLRSNEVYPAPENGLDLTASLKDMIEYPQKAIEDGIEGAVKVLCMVEKDGHVSSLVIVEDIGGGCANQVCKAIRSIKLNPATENGEPRRCAMLVQVRFDLT
jgi:TonB family protein